MGVMRSLTPAEEAEFQSVRGQSDESQIQTISMPIEVVVESRYAVMIRVKIGGRWCWRTWMGFDTCAEATAHSRQENRVVKFRSPEWHALRQQTEVDPPCASSGLPANPPPQGEPETFIEFVLRLLTSHRFDESEASSEMRNTCVQSGEIRTVKEEGDKEKSDFVSPKSLDETWLELRHVFRIPLSLEKDVPDGR